MGPRCSGKNFLKDRYLKRGFIGDVSYTTRNIREGEVNGIDYEFISIGDFKQKIIADEFYEWIEYDNYFYGTGQTEWDESQIFIMETIGISKLTKADRDISFIIYLNPERMVRENRMRSEGKWDQSKVLSRAREDFKRFSSFKDFDLEITNAEF